MADPLTDADVKRIAPPASSSRITYDTVVKGFGIRVTAAGARAFILNYRAAGRERRITIGSYPDWSVRAAREQAKALKRRIDVGEDPMAQRHKDRDAKTVADLCDLYEAEYLPARRASTREDYFGLIKLYIRPELGKTKVEALLHRDIAKLHRGIANRAPYRANRMVAVLSTLMGVAVREGWREDNPTRGIERAREEKRERFLSAEEIVRLAKALAMHPEKISANAIRLLLLTGSRRSEVLTATWDQFDLVAGVWTKPAATTKQRKEHRVPLSSSALRLIADMKKEAVKGCPYVFPSAKTSKAGIGNGPPKYEPLVEVKRTWSSACKAAGLAGVHLHDLRHSFASVLVSGGLSLPVIGALLGHTQPRTTARYAHLYEDVLRAATEQMGTLVAGGERVGADVVPMNPATTQ